MQWAPYAARVQGLQPAGADEEEERVSNNTPVPDRMTRASYKQSAALQRGDQLPVSDVFLCCVVAVFISRKVAVFVVVAGFVSAEKLIPRIVAACVPGVG